MMIQEIKRYTDEKGKSVKEYVPIEKDQMVGARSTFEGTVGIQSPMGVVPIDFPFPEDYTLEQCFENFENIANIEVQKIIEEEKEKNRIVTPSGAPAAVNPNNLKVIK